MKYELILKGTTKQDSGKISLDRLGSLSAILMDIAKDAFQIRTQGFSKSRGRCPAQVTEAVQIQLSGLKEGDYVQLIKV